MICVDASVVLAFLLPDEQFTTQATALFRRWRESQEAMIAPALLHFEVISGIRLAVHSSRIDGEQGDESYAVFRQLPIDLRDPRGVSDRCWSLGKLLNSPRLYDATYLALADSEGCDIWTADRRFLQMVAGRSQRLRWVEDVGG